MYIYKYVQSHVIINQYVSVTLVTIISVYYNKNILFLLQQYMMEHIYKCTLLDLSYKYKTYFNARPWNT